jgi:hypothetical protein
VAALAVVPGDSGGGRAGLAPASPSPRAVVWCGPRLRGRGRAGQPDRRRHWIWQRGSKEEAVEWLERAPFEEGDEVEIRQIFELTDFVQGPAIETHKRLADEIAKL